MPSCRFYAWTLPLSLLASPVLGQTPSPQDTAAVYALAFREAAAIFKERTDTDRITWIREGPGPTPEGSYRRAVALSGPTWQALETHIANIRRAGQADTLVLCPEGREHRMPRGCPIRQGGRILSFPQPEFVGLDEAVVEVIVIDAYKDNRYSYAAVFRMARGADAKWVVVEVLEASIT